MEQEGLSTDRGLSCVLIVDDEPFNIEVLQAILGNRYRLKTALNGERALQIAASEDPPDLILLDVMMPGMSGYEVCKKLKNSERTSRVPVIFISGMQEIEDEVLGFEIGGADYIIKPISAPLVIARVDAHLKLYHQDRQLRTLIDRLSGSPS